jgi:hypothetical protein
MRFSPSLTKAISENKEPPILWWFMLSLSTFIAILFLSQIPEMMRIRQVMQYGDSVPVEIIKPIAFRVGRRDFQYLDFLYQGSNNSVRISYKFFNQIKAKRETKLRHLPKYPDLFLPPDYDTKWQSISHVVLTCFFVFMIPFSIARIYKLRKNNF